MGGAGAIEPRHAVAEVLPEVSGPSSAEVGRAQALFFTTIGNFRDLNN